MFMEIKSVCVVGGGRMGRQIGLCAAINGIDVKVYDLMPEVLADVQKWEDEYLAGRIAKGRMTEEQVAATRARFTLEADLEKAAGDVDCVIECVIEVQDVKADLIRKLDGIIRPDTIVATNSRAEPPPEIRNNTVSSLVRLLTKSIAACVPKKELLSGTG